MPFPNLQGGSFGRQGVSSEQHDAYTLRSHGTMICNNQVLVSMKAYFSKEGVTRCLIALFTSGVVGNSLITFMVYLVDASGSNEIQVGAIGCALRLFILISLFIVDKCSDPFKRPSLLSASHLAGTVVLVMCMIAMEWDSFAGLIASLLTVALIMGSSQTLSTGRGADISQMRAKFQF